MFIVFGTIITIFILGLSHYIAYQAGREIEIIKSRTNESVLDLEDDKEINSKG